MRWQLLLGAMREDQKMVMLIPFSSDFHFPWSFLISQPHCSLLVKANTKASWEKKYLNYKTFLIVSNPFASFLDS